MPRQGITREQVFKAADQLTQDSHNPTWRAVREHLGSGSAETINRHLKPWKEAREAVQAEAAPIPEPVEIALHRVWDLASKKAKEQLQEERQILDAEYENHHQCLPIHRCAALATGRLVCPASVFRLAVVTRRRGSSFHPGMHRTGPGNPHLLLPTRRRGLEG